MQIPPDAHYYIIKNEDEDWTDKGIAVGDRAYFKQVRPSVPYRGPFPFKTYDTREEAIAAKDTYPKELYEATMGKLMLWNAKKGEWERRSEPTIECMGWFAVKFKIYDVRKENAKSAQ